jgi:hypothetical protein
MQKRKREFSSHLKSCQDSQRVNPDSMSMLHPWVQQAFVKLLICGMTYTTALIHSPYRIIIRKEASMISALLAKPAAKPGQE